MPEQTITDYINQQRQAAQSDDQIRETLQQAGWRAGDIEANFQQSSSDRTPPPSPPAPVKLRGPLDLLQESITIFTTIWLKLILLIVLPYLVTTIIGLGIGVVVYLFFLKGIYQPDSPATALAAIQKISQIGFGSWFFINTFTFLVFLVVNYFTFWGQLALMQAIKDHRQKISIKSAFISTWKKVLPLWWIIILEILIILGGFPLLFIPTIFIIYWFVFGIWVLLDENIGGLPALLKSKFYIQGNFFSVLFKFISVGGGYFLVIVVLSIFLGQMDDSLIKTVLNLVIGLSGLVAGPVLLIYQYLLYQNLKQLKTNQTFIPTKKSKVIFIIMALLGLLPILAIVSTFIQSFPINESQFTLPEISPLPTQQIEPNSQGNKITFLNLQPNSLIISGETLTIEIHAPDITEILLVAPSFAQTVANDGSDKFTFQYPIPLDTTGEIKLAAVGKDAAGEFINQELTVSVRLGNIDIISLRPINDLMLVKVGETRQITVMGKLSDGNEIDITSNFGTRYITATDWQMQNNPGNVYDVVEIIKVDENGLVTAVRAGSETVIVSHPNTTSENVSVVVE